MNKYMQSRNIHTILCSTLLPPRLFGSIRSRRLLLLCFRTGSLSSSPSAYITKMKLLVTFSASSFCFASSSAFFFSSSSCCFVFFGGAPGAAARFLASRASFSCCLIRLIRGSRLEIRMQVVSAEPNVNDTKHYLTRESYQQDLWVWRYLPSFCALARIYFSSRYIVYHRGCNCKNWNQTHQGRYWETHTYHYLR